MGDMREAHEDVITLANVDGTTLQALIRFFYLGKIDISDHVEELLTAVSGMELVRVENLCEQHCLKRLSRDNCLRLWLLADRYSLAELMEKALVMVMDSFPLLVAANEDFLQLEMKSLQLLLGDDNLTVLCEEDVLDALVRWVRLDEDNRKAHFTQLMSVVRVDEMKPEVNTE